MSWHRERGVREATMMGLVFIIDAGVFMGIGIAAGMAGAGVVVAVVIAAAVATCNALNSARPRPIIQPAVAPIRYGYPKNRQAHPDLLAHSVAAHHGQCDQKSPTTPWPQRWQKSPLPSIFHRWRTFVWHQGQYRMNGIRSRRSQRGAGQRAL
jgi:hypothetical protein